MLTSYEGIATRHIENEDLSDSVEFINIDSTGCTDSNETEATKAVERAIHYKEMGENVAIVTPFRKQENLIREKWIASGQNLNGILIDTVERLQGIDVDVIIISTSVSDEDYFKQIDSFLLNRKRLNVMLSRAKKKVVIIKNSLISIYSYCGTDNMLYLSNKETKQDEMFVIKNEPKMVVENRQHILTQFGDLEFYEQGHRYLLNGKSLCSVSSIGHRFLSKPFDSKEQARKYALKHGETPEFWLNKWSCNSFKATTLGTKTHEFGESYGYFRNGHPEKILPQIKTQYNADLNYLAPIHPKEEAVVKFLEELPSAYHLVLNETKVYSGKNPDINKNLKEQICGTFDMLYYYDGDGDKEKAGFVVFDYKTNAHLMNEYNRSHNIKLREPFNSFYEEDLGLYTIQLSLYSLMLEDIGLKVIDRRLVWLKDDGSYETISLEDVSDKLRSIL